MVISSINSRYGTYAHSYVTRGPLLVEEVERLLGGVPVATLNPKPYLNPNML